MSDRVDTIARAFPRHGDRTPFCHWCGAQRESWMALCRRCWGSLDRETKDIYTQLDLFERAEWILANKARRPARA